MTDLKTISEDLARIIPVFLDENAHHHPGRSATGINIRIYIYMEIIAGTASAGASPPKKPRIIPVSVYISEIANLPIELGPINKE